MYVPFWMAYCARRSRSCDKKCWRGLRKYCWKVLRKYWKETSRSWSCQLTSACHTSLKLCSWECKRCTKTHMHSVQCTLHTFVIVCISTFWRHTIHLWLPHFLNLSHTLQVPARMQVKQYMFFWSDKQHFAKLAIRYIALNNADIEILFLHHHRASN